MSQSTREVCQDLNTLLEGCHMGSATFQEYLSQTCSSHLKTTLTEALTIFRHHETALKHHIEALGESCQDEIKIGGIFAEFFEKMKAELAVNDRQLLDYAVRGIDMGLKACQDFKKKHHGLQMDLLKSVEDIESDYKRIYQNLIDLKLNQD